MAESTIKPKILKFKKLLRLGVNLYDSDEVLETINNLPVGNGTKNLYIQVYKNWLDFKGLKYEIKKRYSYEAPVPYIPTEAELDQLIGAFGKKYSTLLQFFKETGCDPVETLRVTRRDIQLSENKVSVNHPCKGHNTRVIKISNRLAGLLQPLVNSCKLDEPIWRIKRIQHLNQYFYAKRKKIAKKLNNINLLRISLKTFRHFKGTMEYHKTKDILWVRYILGHKQLSSTLVYTHLVNFKDDEYTVRVASTLNECTKLLESGFEYVTDYQDKKLFRKRK